MRYLERSEPGSGDLGDIALRDSLGLPMDGARELAREGGGRRSGEGFSSGEAVGGTTVASDLRLPDLCLVSVTDGGCCSCSCSCPCSFVSSFVPVSSASSVISISRRRRRELDEEVIDPEAVCKRQADDRALSLSSDAWVRASTVSFGVNLSRTDWN